MQLGEGREEERGEMAMKLQIDPINDSIYFLDFTSDRRPKDDYHSMLVGLRTYQYRREVPKPDFWWVSESCRIGKVSLMIPVRSVPNGETGRRWSYKVEENIQVEAGLTIRHFDCRVLREFTGLTRGSDGRLWFVDVPTVFNSSSVLFFDGALVSMARCRCPIAGDEVERILAYAGVKAVYVDEDEMFKLYCERNAGSRIKDEKIEDPLVGMLRGFPFADGNRLMFARFI